MPFRFPIVKKKKFKILIKTILQRCEGVQCGDNKSDDRYKQGVYCIYSKFFLWDIFKSNFNPLKVNKI